MARQPEKMFRVSVGGVHCRGLARQAGSAADKAFAVLIGLGHLKNRPQRADCGGWVGVEIVCLGRPAECGPEGVEREAKGIT